MTRESSRRKDVWAGGDLYEPYVGRWSRLVAREFLACLAVPEKRNWLDVGCGPGALTHTSLESKSPRSVTSLDLSVSYVEYARAQVSSRRVTFAVADARSMPIEAGTVDVAVSGLVLNFVPQPSRAVADMKRVVRPGGVVAAYVWDYAGRMELMRYFWDAAVALDAGARELDEGRRFPICQPDALGELFAEAGLRDVEVRAIDVPTAFRNFDDYWSPFLGGQGPAPGYAVSLSEAKRDALRDRVRGNLPVGADGSIRLIARAWSVRGDTP